MSPRKRDEEANESVKLTLSVTRGLRQRMAKFDDAVNWSGLARLHFERRVEMLEEKIGRSKLSAETIARLQESEERETHEDKLEGYKAGREWAEQQATMGELRRLADGPEHWADAELMEPSKPAQVLAKIVNRNIATLGLPNTNVSRALVEAFVEGALEVLGLYDEAK